LCALGAAPSSAIGYTAIDLASLALDDVAMLANYPHLCDIVLDGNPLSPEALYHVLVRRGLTSLSLNECGLSSLLSAESDTNLVPPSISLGTLSLAGNKMREPPCLDFAPYLEKLSMSRNGLRRLDLPKLDFLRVLDLSHNSIRSIDSIPAMPVRELNLSNNKLTTLEGIDRLPNLTRLDVGHNALTDLDEINGSLHPWLSHVDVSHNQLTMFTSFKPLRTLKLLRSLTLKLLRSVNVAGNPIQDIVTIRDIRNGILSDAEQCAFVN
ncbi:hypothetical protein KIPB_010037, partial [Kipferlia bialata]